MKRIIRELNSHIIRKDSHKIRMRLKKGDKVKMLVGKDRGKTGKILRVWTDRNKVSVEGLNLLIKHMRPKREREKGQRVQFPRPVDVSDVKLICPKCGKPTRVGYKITQGDRGKKRKFRMCKKCKQTI